MALIECDPAFFDHAGDDSGFCGAGTDCANALTTALRDLVNRRAHFACGQKCVTAAIHRSTAGVRGLAAKRDRVAFDSKCSKHGPEREIEIEEDWTLFDVQFDVSRGVSQFFP